MPILPARLLTLTLALQACTLFALPSQNVPKATLAPQHLALLKDHCHACHNADKQKGKFRIDDLSFEVSDAPTAERWKKVLASLNAGEMPPEEEKQPSKEAKADLLDDLAKTLVVAQRNLSDSRGVVTMRRLNQREYGNSIEALLETRVDVHELPADTGANHFDTAGSSLFLSGDQFEQYLELGRTAVTEAFERLDHASKPRKTRFEPETGTLEAVAKSVRERTEGRRRYMLWKREVDRAAEKPENRAAVDAIRKELKNEAQAIYHRWDKVPGAPSPAAFGFTDAFHALHVGVGQWGQVPYQSWFLSMPENRTGVWLSVGDVFVKPSFSFSLHGWPAGDCVVRLRVAASDKVDARRRYLEFVGARGGNPFNHDSRHSVTGTLAEPQIMEIPITLRSNGVRTFYVRERGTHDGDSIPPQRFGVGAAETGVGPDFAIWLDYVEVEQLPAKAPAPGMQAISRIVGDPKTEVPPGDLRSALEAFCIEAFRGRNPSPAFLDRLQTIYADHRQHGMDHRASLREVLALVLASPRFLYLNEPLAEDRTPSPARSGNLGAMELATRLSYFLWGAPPDRELREAAANGSLLEPAILRQQTDRLLEDPRSAGFIRPFVHQWLRMERLDFFRFNTKRYPLFDLSAKEAARNEVFETFAYLLKSNRSAGELLKADYVVVDSLLATYYGLEGVRGDHYRPVPLPPGSPRGGLLGMAAILAMGSNGEHTSPVERGAWVLRKLLHEPPPPAPANVPQLTRLEDKLITTRERLQLHQEQPQCASCHRRIDPIGFGLENFDAAGQWRTEDSYERAGLGRKTWQIEPAGAFHQGPAFAGYEALRDEIHARKASFARGLSQALVEYALGRAAGFTEDPLLERMVEAGAGRGFPMREFIHTLVSSKEFQSK
jgi:mono/diheme cytochrome c family protein